MGQSAKEVILALFRDVVQAPVLDMQAVERYVSPRYVQHVDGVTLDYAGFVAHMQKQKKAIAAMSVAFVALVQDPDGHVVFSHHVVEARKKDGGLVRVKVLAQFTVADGRLVGCDELTQLLSGAHEDRDLGSRK